MGWILRVQVDTRTLDLASAVLWDAGTSGVAHLADDPSGPAGLSDVVAGFETEPEASAATERLRDALGGDAVVVASVEPVDPGAWADPDRRVAATVAGHELMLAPGAAFGDGGHPTTRLSLGLLASLGDLGGRTVIDFGAGTGILALAALAQGADAAVAVENDPAAVEALAATLSLNAEVIDGRSVDVVTELPPEPKPANVVLANVLLVVHQEWGSRLARRRAPDGVLVVSGLLVEQEEAVLACYPDLVVQDRRREGDWLGLTLGPTTPSAARR